MTIVAVLLAVIAFAGDGPTGGGLFDPFRLLGVFGGADLVWLGQNRPRAIRAPGAGRTVPSCRFSTRFGPVFITGITNSLRQPKQAAAARSDTAGK